MGLALHDGQKILAQTSWQSENNHTIELAPNVAKLLREQKISVRDLTALGVALGPGSFNGVRIGLSFAKGLALPQKIPIIGARTLDILVRGVQPIAGKLIAVIQAGRGRIVWAQYHVEAGRWVSVSAGEVGEWEIMLAQADSETRIVGEIESRWIDSARIQILPRDPVYLAEIVREQLAGAATASGFANLAPIYAHQPTSGTT
jgi:tRNA threonylcarbamoyladenosine biosynthesis protein TsaB